MHPLYGNSLAFEKLTGLDVVAAKRGWAVLYPQGLSGSWNAGGCCGFAQREQVDDVGYVLDLIRAARAAMSLTTEPTDLMGYSNGGMLALEMMCTVPNEVSSVGAVSANLEVRTCSGARPFLMIRGSADTTVPPRGGWSSTAQATLLPDLAGVRLIVQAAACAPQVVTVTKGKVTKSVINCAGRPLGTYLLLGGAGHDYPSSRRRDLVDATKEIADFFGANR
jgi:polyhydroxybutyrate depolymerase